ncbi:MAG: endolytic transglycosylase MltG [Neisseria sp.]|nr:endolytic transglycosylase MltG [Neisseria sp.]
MKKRTWLILIALVLLGIYAALLFVPKNNAQSVRMKVEKGQGIASVSRNLAKNDVVFSRPVLVATAYLLGIQNKLHAGNYRLPKTVSTWQIIRRLQNGRPDSVSVQIIEGMRFSQMRRIINQTEDLQHETRGWSDEQLLKAIDPNAVSKNPEGLFAPDSYEVDADSSDLAVYRLAYRNLQKNLANAWDDRQSGLPYKNPYEMLIMASLIEKETANEKDRKNVASVFVNRLKINMRLQTDPTVIYGMGANYKGKIRKADLRRDTPYNTYTRNGLPPTPIALPSEAALEAAAHPASSDYFYFVSKMDNTGESYFSKDLDEHNAAVRKYILKK